MKKMTKIQMNRMNGEDCFREVMDIITDMRLSKDPEYVSARIRIGNDTYMMICCDRGYGSGIRRSSYSPIRENIHERYFDMDIAERFDAYYNFENPYYSSPREEMRIRNGFKPSDFTISVYKNNSAVCSGGISGTLKQDILDMLELAEKMF